MVVEGTTEELAYITPVGVLHVIYNKIEKFLGWIIEKIVYILTEVVKLLPKFFETFANVALGQGTFASYFVPLALIITIFVLFFRNNNTRNKKKRQPDYMKTLKKIFLPSHNLKMTFKSLTRFRKQFTSMLPFDNQQNPKAGIKSDNDTNNNINNIGETKREVFTQGRCNNVSMIERGIICVSTSVPKPIEWIIDPDKMSDYNNISQETKQNLIGNGSKYKITIPWKIYTSDGTHYYPNCSEAKFCNGESAAYLFTNETATQCSKKKIPRDTYTSKERPTFTSWKGLTNYLN